MKRSMIMLSLLTAALFATASIAGPPLDGAYDSTDLGGPVDVGRYSEGWATPDGALTPGMNTLNASSWDGMNLGLQWRYYCSTLASDPVLLMDTVSATGNGSRTYQKNFSGGFVWLSGTGPWANGDAEYTGTITTYVEFETIQYLNHERVAAVTNVVAEALIDGYPDMCMVFSVGNGAEIGSTDFGEMLPADYPGFLDGTSCDATMPFGSWWDLMTLTLTLNNCAVSVESSSFGAVKSLYR